VTTGIEATSRADAVATVDRLRAMLPKPKPKKKKSDETSAPSSAAPTV
jgi:hypothetical protein